MTVRTYESPEAFRQALEQRLRNEAASGAGLVRRRQLLVFDRFLARIVTSLGDAVTLKGGLVLELRLERARSTKDIDLRLEGTSIDLLSRLQSAARMDLADFMAFEVRTDPEHPRIENGGLRFRAEGRLAGKPYGQPFGVDIVFGDPMLGDPETIAADDWLAFAGIPPPFLRICPLETHVAEKLHAYTRPRPRPNSRVKDLPDLALLATHRQIDSQRLRAAFALTFDHSRTHALPLALPEPPASWGEPYAAMAQEDRLPWQTIREVTAAVQGFLDPVLASDRDATWQPETWTWQPRAAAVASGSRHARS